MLKCCLGFLGFRFLFDSSVGAVGGSTLSAEILGIKIVITQQQKLGILSLRGYRSGINRFINKPSVPFYRYINSLPYAIMIKANYMAQRREVGSSRNLPKSLCANYSEPQLTGKTGHQWTQLLLQLLGEASVQLSGISSGKHVAGHPPAMTSEITHLKAACSDSLLGNLKKSSV